jgi:hypothetical protein
MIRASGSLTPVVAIAKDTGHHDLFANATLEPDPRKFLTGLREVLTEAGLNMWLSACRTNWKSQTTSSLEN